MKQFFTTLLLVLVGSMGLMAQFNSPSFIEENTAGDIDLENLLPLDVNNDGWEDIIAYQHDVGWVVYYSESVEGTAWSAPETIAPFTGLTVFDGREAKTSDVDNDGDEDFIVMISDEAIVYVYYNEEGDFSNVMSYSYSSFKRHPEEMDVADFDNDGDIDIFWYTRYDDQVVWMENMDGEGTFGTLRGIGSTSYSATEYGRLGDFDGDGNIDVVMQTQEMQYTIFKNVNGTGEGWESQVLDVTSEIDGTGVVDWNNDGQADILTWDGTSTYIKLQETGSPSTFLEQALVYSGGSNHYRDHVTYDIDGNGFTDIVVVSDYRVRYIMNDGTTTAYASATIEDEIAIGYYTYIVHLDANNDGLIDVATTGRFSGIMHLFINNGEEIPPALGLQIDIEGSPVPCWGDAAMASLTITGGVPPYEVKVNATNFGEQTELMLSAGQKTITITDANGSTIAQTVTIEGPENPVTIGSFDVVNATSGMMNGSVTANVTGGTPPYTYSWNDPASQTTQTATNLSGGLYLVEVWDTNGCYNILGAQVGVETGLWDVTTTSISLFPNPATAAIQCTIPQNWQPSNVKIINITGTIVADFKWTSTHIATNDLNTGTYFLLLENEAGEQAIGRFLVKK